MPTAHSLLFLFRNLNAIHCFSVVSFDGSAFTVAYARTFGLRAVPNSFIESQDDTWTDFDDNYYQKLVNGGGSFKSDQTLIQNSRPARTYADDQTCWSVAFIDATKKLGDLGAQYR
jgi:hypothetical protein